MLACLTAVIVATAQARGTRETRMATLLVRSESIGDGEERRRRVGRVTFSCYFKLLNNVTFYDEIHHKHNLHSHIYY